MKGKFGLNNKLSLTCGIIIFVFSLEIICRLLFIDISPPVRPSKLSNINWEFVPNSKGKTGRHVVKINSFSLRDYEFNKDKKQGTFRILAMGGSFTYGLGLPLERTYPKLLEGNLNKNSISKYYQVINAGFPEYSLSSLVAYLKQKSSQLQPNLILISLEPEVLISEFIPPRCKKELRMESPGRLLMMFKQKSYLVSFFYSLFDNLCRQNEISSFKYAAQLRYPAEPNPMPFKDTTGYLMNKELVSPLIPVTSINPGISIKDHSYAPRKSTSPIPTTKIKMMLVENDSYVKPRSPVPGDYNYSLLQFLCDTKRPYWLIYKNNFQEIVKFCQEINTPVLFIIWPDPYKRAEDAPCVYPSAQLSSLIEPKTITVLDLSSFLKDGESKLWIGRHDNLYPDINLHLLAAEELYNLLRKIYTLD